MLLNIPQAFWFWSEWAGSRLVDMQLLDFGIEEVSNTLNIKKTESKLTLKLFSRQNIFSLFPVANFLLIIQDTYQMLNGIHVHHFTEFD